MKAILITEENKNFNQLKGLAVGTVKRFSKLPNYWGSQMPFNADAVGFFEIPTLTKYQKLGDYNPTINNYDVVDFTQQEIEDYDYDNNKDLRIHSLEPTFNVPIDLVSNIAYESEKVYNEFSGLKEKTTYVNASDEIVAIKNFSIYNENSKKGTRVSIDFYDKNNEVSESCETLDYYSDLQISQHKTKCIIRVFERLMHDVEVELEQLEFIINNYSEEQLSQVILALGIPNIETLQAIPTQLRAMFDDLFKVKLKDEVDLIYKTGNSTQFFNKISDATFYPNLDQQALTSEQEVKYTYRQILQAKFNPTNFDFYA